MRGGLFGSQFGKLVVGRNGFRIDFPDMHRFAGRLNMDGGRAIGKADVDGPRSNVGRGVTPEKRGRRDFGRKDGTLCRVIDGDCCQAVRRFLGRRASEQDE